MKKFCLALFVCSSFFYAYGMDSDDDFGGHRLTDEEAKRAGMLTSVEIAQQYEFARAMTPATLDGWAAQVHNLQEADGVQAHLISLFSNFYAISKNIEKNNFDAAYTAFEKVSTLRGQVEAMQESNPTLCQLLRSAYGIHLEPKKTPFIAAFDQAKIGVLQKNGYQDQSALSAEDENKFVRQAWNQCTNELRAESEMRFSRVVLAGAALSKCEPAAWMVIAQTQVALQSKKQTKNASCSLQ
jgi:hypothetical protein